jgi:hypothetical protein
MTLKKFSYIGWWFNYDQIKNFIDTASENKITHIVLQFITLYLNNNGTNDVLTYADTVNAWMSLTSDQRINLKSQASNKGITIVVSAFGATSFSDGFQYIFNSPNYNDPAVLATDLVSWMKSYNCNSIDLDIEHLPMESDYPNTDQLAQYIGLLSQYIKNFYNTDVGFYPELSHAPQPPYFNGNGNWSLFGYVYNRVEQYYGKYIDYYLIQYYNQGSFNYTTYDSMFFNDFSYYASVKELINASTISYKYANIPVNKIILGKPNNQKEVSVENGFVALNDPAFNPNTMTEFVNKTKTATDTDISNWATKGGLMVWIYLFDQVDQYNNNELLKYYFNT